MSSKRRQALILLPALGLTVLVVTLLAHKPEFASANPLSAIVAVSAGDYLDLNPEGHTCALTTAGGVQCWGYGQLFPVSVTGLTSGVSAVSAGELHNCALTTAGGVKCWGNNAFGELGDGTTTGRSTPVDVTGLAGPAAAVSGGAYHTCVLTTSGGVKCWGDNRDGQLGDGQACGAFVCATPVDVSGLSSGVLAVSAGGNHTCAVTIGGGVKCWGFNYDGALGDGQACGGVCSTPVDVAGLSSGVSAVSVGHFHACALTNAGGVMCWGAGQLGDGGTCGYICPTPQNVSGLSSGVSAITQTCALTTAGGVKCWGDNSHGQVGDGQSCGHDCSTPVDVSGLSSGVAAVSAGGFHTCALLSAGNVKCWGDNSSGQLGDGNFLTASTTPVDVLSVPKGPPTPTPCPTGKAPAVGGGCGTPTPPGFLSGLDFSIGIGTQCDSTSGPAKCTFNVGDTFALDMKLNSIPAGFSYDGYDFTVYYNGVVANPVSLVQQGLGVWPPCVSTGSYFGIPGYAQTGCASGIDAQSSTDVGTLEHVDFQCPDAPVTATLTLIGSPRSEGVNLTDVVVRADAFAAYHQAADESLTINCVAPPTATPTPPHPVGGVSLDAGLDSSGLRTEGTASGVRLELVVALMAAAAGLVTIAGLLWRARASHSARR
jgi:alpha-tubulin suppressor-like RCC1 family protein